MKYKNIEFICSGNFCRSIVAEAIALKYLHDNNIKDVNVYSSGVLVNTLDNLYKNGSDILDSIPNFINELYNQDKIGKYQRIMIQKLFDYIKRKIDAKKIMKELGKNIDSSHKRVGHFLAKNGIKSYKHIKEQTIARNSDLILTMSDDNLKGIKRIYADSGFHPDIYLLTEFGGLNQKEIKDPLMTDEHEFFEISEIVKTATLNSMKKILEH